MTKQEIIKPDAATQGIAGALVSAQKTMGKALKQSSNPHFKSKYADLSSVIDACMGSLNDAGIAVIQPTGEDENGRYVETRLIHAASGDTLSCRVPLIVAKNDMQGYGSAVTYARRYGLMAMTGIAPEDDDGNAAAKAPPMIETPKRPNAHAVEAATSSLWNADTLDALRNIWTDLPKDIQSVPAVIKAKDGRKAEIDVTPKPAPADDLDGDAIPNFGAE